MYLSNLSYGRPVHMTPISSQYKTMSSEEQQISSLNHLGLMDKKGYQKEQCGIIYDNDARVVDQRGMRIILDRPALVGEVNMDDVYNIDNKGYGGTYETYNQINNGNVMYYVDQSVSQPFYDPVYTLSSTVKKEILLDPMTNPKPEYSKTVDSTLYGVVNDQYARDQLTFREELMSRQQNLYNRTSWTNRWIK